MRRSVTLTSAVLMNCRTSGLFRKTEGAGVLVLVLPVPLCNASGFVTSLHFFAAHLLFQLFQIQVGLREPKNIINISLVNFYVL